MFFIIPLETACWYSFDCSRKDERKNRPWSHRVFLYTGSLNWESSALDTRPLLHNTQLENQQVMILPYAKFWLAQRLDNNEKVEALPSEHWHEGTFHPREIFEIRQQKEHHQHQEPSKLHFTLTPKIPLLIRETYTRHNDVFVHNDVSVSFENFLMIFVQILISIWVTCSNKNLIFFIKS